VVVVVEVAYLDVASGVAVQAEEDEVAVVAGVVADVAVVTVAPVLVVVAEVEPVRSNSAVVVVACLDAFVVDVEERTDSSGQVVSVAEGPLDLQLASEAEAHLALSCWAHLNQYLSHLMERKTNRHHHH
jgi:hypothetical protein